MSDVDNESTFDGTNDQTASSDTDTDTDYDQKENLKIEQPIPVYFMQQPIERIIEENENAKYLSFSLNSNFIRVTSYLKPNDFFSSYTVNVFPIIKNDVELLRLSLIVEENNNNVKIFMQYRYDLDTLQSNEEYRYNLGTLHPLPDYKTIHLPYADISNIIIDNGNRNIQIKDLIKNENITVVSIKLCDVKNNSKHGPMLILEINDVNKKDTQTYCRRVNSTEAEEIKLCQVCARENKSITFSFPCVSRLKEIEPPKNKNDKWIKFKRNLKKYWYVYYLIGLGMIGILIQKLMDEKK